VGRIPRVTASRAPPTIHPSLLRRQRHRTEIRSAGRPDEECRTFSPVVGIGDKSWSITGTVVVEDSSSSSSSCPQPSLSVLVQRGLRSYASADRFRETADPRARRRIPSTDRSRLLLSVCRSRALPATGDKRHQNNVSASQQKTARIIMKKTSMQGRF